MGLIFLILWTASSRAVRQITVVLVCLTIGPKLCGAETLKGVVFSDDSGPSADATGMVQLAVGKTVYDLYYGEPLKREFRSKTCWDIGAIWSVVVRMLPELDSTREIDSVSCTGQVDDNAHGPWLVVRDYLQVAQDPSRSPYGLLSARWRASPEFRQYEAKVKGLDLSGYGFFGVGGRCIEVVKVERAGRTRLRAGECALYLSGKLVDLVFTVVRNARSHQWEIDEIKVE
jgi:hypothetical protein